jgi:energy-coupling factor transporter ATP-binding protein EcfA2
MPKRIRIVSIRLVNFKSYADYTVDFTNGSGSIQRMTGLFGRNGVGKSTLLDAIGMLFKKFNGLDQARLATSMRRYIRNVKNVDVAGEFSTSSVADDSMTVSGFGEVASERFSIQATFAVEDGRTYDVEIGNTPDLFHWSKEGFITGVKKWHPGDIDESLMSQCYVTTYDKELNKFQLVKSRWPVFKELFTAVSGFDVDKLETEFSPDTPAKHLAMLDKYVLGLKISKPGETISDRQCSDGEKKIVKNFTTLLNLEFIPSIILIDNVEMHVEIDRHIPLIEAIEKCFPDSQVVFTTHSEKIITEAPLDMLIPLTNKLISRSDVWRRKMGRVVKAMKLMFRDQESKGRLAAIEADLENHLITDAARLGIELETVLKNGSARLAMEIPGWAKN